MIPAVGDRKPNEYANREQTQVRPDNEQAIWLKMVEYHSQNCSPESQQVLGELYTNIPQFDSTDPEEQALLTKLKMVAETKMYDPRLSPDSKNLLYGTVRKNIDYSAPKPHCARTLNFPS